MSTSTKLRKLLSNSEAFEERYPFKPIFIFALFLSSFVTFLLVLGGYYIWKDIKSLNSVHGAACDNVHPIISGITGNRLVSVGVNTIRDEYILVLLQPADSSNVE